MQERGLQRQWCAPPASPPGFPGLGGGASARRNKRFVLKLRVVIFNWRDLAHPKAGGAEVVTHALAVALARRGHRILWFTSRPPGTPPREDRDGYAIERRGNELTCRFFAWAWLRRNAGYFDVAIDEVNTLPFLSRFATNRPVVLWLHQLAREVWLAEAPPLLGRIGYLLEPAMLRSYRRGPIVTVSPSSAASFVSVGLGADAAVVGEPLAPAEDAVASPRVGRIGYAGRITPSKRIDHILRALALVRAQLPDAELVVVGRGSTRELRQLQALARRLGVGAAVTFAGRLSDDARDAVLRTCDVVAMTSLREGWGLVVSEAARFRVPSVVYPVAGLVDSVQNDRTGIVVDESTPEALAASIVRVVRNRALRKRLGDGAAQYLDAFSETRFVDAFEDVLLTAVRAAQQTRA